MTARQVSIHVKQQLATDPRRVKGTSIIQLVKLLRDVRQKRPLRLSPAGAQFLEQRIMPTEWYPLSMMVELMHVMFEQLQGSDPRVAMQGGITSGVQQLSGPYNGFVITGDPVATVLSMRHLWRASYDFGMLEAVSDGPRSVLFTLSGFPDITVVHAIMTASWAVAAAQVSGPKGAKAELVEKPWEGSALLRYRVTF